MADTTLSENHADTFPPCWRHLHVAVVIPAYGVASQIEEVIRTVPPLVRTIIVIDDGSPDDTAERVERLNDGRVTLIRHSQNQGVGGAMISGFQHAIEIGCDIAVKMDGDGQMDPAHLGRLLKPLLDHTADFVKGNRFRNLQSLQGMPRVRIVGNAGLTFLLKLASGHWRMFDPTNGYFAVRSDVLKRLNLDRLPRRYFFESGLLIELGLLGAKVQDVPIPARYGDESSSLSVRMTLLEFPVRLLWNVMRRVVRQYFLYDFTSVSVFLLFGLPMFLFGVIFGAWKWYESCTSGVVASTGTVMVAALPIILGFQLLLQAVVVDISNIPDRPLSEPLRPADQT